MPPTPPAPMTATRCPARSPARRSPLNAVIPAHISGAPATGSRPSGSGVTNPARPMKYSPYPPSTPMPVIFFCGHRISSPRTQ